jgi:hypothetical protein
MHRSDPLFLSALRRPLVADRYRPIFCHPRLEETLHHALYPLVAYTVRQEFYQPFLFQIVEEAFDVNFYNMIYRLAFHCLTQRPERFVTASAGTESIGILYEVLFVYRFQYLNQSRLNKFVFKNGIPKGRCLAVPGFGMYLRRTGCGMYAIRLGSLGVGPNQHVDYID